MANEGEGAGSGAGAGEGSASALLMGDQAGGQGGGDGTGGAGDAGAAGAGAAGAGEGGAGGAGDGAGGGAAGSADPDWYANLSAETGEGETASLRDVAKAKGWKTMDDVVKSYREVERAFRDSGRVKVPGENATAEERSAFAKAIGVPDAPEGYQFAAVKDADGNDVPLDNGLLQRIASTAHAAGVPKAALEAVVNDFVQAQLEAVGTADAQHRQEAAAWANEQGQAKAEKLAAVDRAAKALGLSSAEVIAIRGELGGRRTMEVLARLGAGIGEDVLLGPDNRQQFLMSGDQAQAEIDRMKADPAIVAKLTVKGTPEYAKYNRLLNAVGETANRRAAAGL